MLRPAWLAVLAVIFAVPLVWAHPPDALEQAVRLQREGKNDQALRALTELLPELRKAADRAPLATALASVADASMALGDYQSTIQNAQEAFHLHRALGRHTDAAWDLNTVGLAHFYLGQYDAALDSYQRALALDRGSKDGDGEVTRLNNIGNVHYMRGRYGDALTLYEEALANVDTRTTERSRARLRKMTLSNLAALFQRLGANERALDFYARLRTAGTMQPSEEAQLLINEGALFRRLGDPIKALETYRRAQQQFAAARHRDGEIGAWRNIGIAYALDLDDAPRALEAFGEAVRLARDSANLRGEVQALLYRGETLRRNGQLAEATRELQAALASTEAAGLVEERWKALYSIGRVFEREGQRDKARRSFEQAIAAFESVRSDLRTLTLRSEFLADKRDVYDALIALRLSESEKSLPDVFRLLEQSRARTWQDRLQADAKPPSLADVQSKIPAGTLLLEYWSGTTGLAVLWITSADAGLVTSAAGSQHADAIRRLIDSLQQPGGDWRTASVDAGRVLLAGLPDLRGVNRVLVVPDGQLHFVPFEALAVPDSSDLLVQRAEVSYLPSAALLLRPTRGETRWRWPWERHLLAFGDPASSSTDLVRGASAMPRLPYAEEEIRGIAALLPGRAELYIGTEAKKQRLGERVHGVPLLHFSTHAIADTRDPDRSRILMASAAGSTLDYLFLREIYDLDLEGVQLVTLSACSTERGPVIRGEGVEGFSRALLAAGAASAITTLWDVTDRASAEFMKQFYFALAQGESEAAALQSAKLQFLRSPLAWSHPRYWAGYVLTGTGQERLRRVIPWSVLVGIPGLIAFATALYLRRSRQAGARR